MEAYPAKLPGFRASDYGYEDEDNLDRTTIDGGAVAVAIRTHQNGTIFRVTSRMTYSMLRIFEGFWKYSINRGQTWFALNLDVGEGLQAHTARWIGPYAAKKDGGSHWIVSGQVEVDAKAVLDYAETVARL